MPNVNSLERTVEHRPIDLRGDSEFEFLDLFFFYTSKVASCQNVRSYNITDLIIYYIKYRMKSIHTYYKYYILFLSLEGK